MMTPLGTLLRAKYSELVKEPYYGHRTDLAGHSKPLFSWLQEAARMVLFAEGARGQGHCYFGRDGNEGMRALENARQFLRWSTLELDLNGAPGGHKDSAAEAEPLRTERHDPSSILGRSTAPPLPADVPAFPSVGRAAAEEER